MHGRIATIVGATGFIGSELLQLLRREDEYKTIRLLVRKPIQPPGNNVEVKLIDFDDQESFKVGIDGSDVIFCAVGTTQAKVGGNKEAYRKVDYEIPVRAAQFCKETGCGQFLLVSAVGADSQSSNFYLRLKGEVEDAIKNMELTSVQIFRPSLLLGTRKERRVGERMAQMVMPAFSFLLRGRWTKYKPIKAIDVASAMVNAAKQATPGFCVYHFSEMKILQGNT